MEPKPDASQGRCHAASDGVISRALDASALGQKRKLIDHLVGTGDEPMDHKRTSAGAFHISAEGEKLTTGSDAGATAKGQHQSPTLQLSSSSPI